MAEERESRKSMEANVGRKEARRIRARLAKEKGYRFGMGAFGLVGWSVAVPLVSLTLLGVWIDSWYTGPYSWTLMLLMAGLCLGCANAWFWLNKERTDILRERDDEK